MIDLNGSKYELLSELDPNNPLINTYDFKKIKIIGDLDPTSLPLIFIDPYLIELIIKDTFFNFIKDEQLKGFSFLELSKFEIHKIFEKMKTLSIYRIRLFNIGNIFLIKSKHFCSK